MKLLFSFFILAMAVSLISAGASEGGNKDSIPANFKIAFIGDQGINDNAKAVLKLIRDEKTDMVLHQGDFDYENDPDAWLEQIDTILGPDFPYFASVGNVDVAAWKGWGGWHGWRGWGGWNGWGGYQSKLESRLKRIEGASCTGDLGVNSACTYKGIFFLLSGIGTLGFDHIDYMKQALESSGSKWKICSWHKNQRFMQVGAMDDEVGWQAYEVCRQAGAFVATGHEHSYSRTHLMSSFEEQIISSTSDNLILSEGKSFAFVSGLGGFSIFGQADELGSKPWWASVYTADEQANYGALFCSFNPQGKDDEAACYFKSIDGNIVDSFSLTSRLNRLQ